MPSYLTFATARVKIKLASDFFPNSHFCDNECLKWCLVRYSNPTDHHPINKSAKDFGRKLDFKDIKFQKLCQN